MGTAVNMVPCQVSHLICSSIFFFLLSGSRADSVKDQESGFYTTRFGRSDPSLRMHELTTRYSPETRVLRSSEWQSRSQPRLWEVVDEDIKYSGMAPLICLFSSARNAYRCSKAEPWSVNQPAVDISN